jgi:PKD repeat protein
MKFMHALAAIFLMAFISFHSSAQSTVILGSDIKYSYAGGDSFYVTAYVYAQCKGTPSINKQITVRTGCGKVKTYTGNLSGYRDITPSCAGQCTSCSSSSCTSPFYGIQQYWLTAYVKIDTSCTQHWISWSGCCRSNDLKNITPGKQHYNEAYLYYNKKKYSYLYTGSPYFTNPAVGIFEQGLCYQHNPSASDDNNSDSLIYKLEDPLSGHDTTIAFDSSFSAKYPFKVNGYPSTTWNSSTCSGFNLDSAGVLHFQAKDTGRVALVYVVEAWRKDSTGKAILISKTRRDMQYYFKMNSGNNLPIASGFDSSSVFVRHFYVGRSECATLTTNDADVNDTLFLFWNNQIKGATFTVPGNNKIKRPKGTFCWTPGKGDFRKEPYEFTVTATDNKCPLPGRTTQTFRIYVENLDLKMSPIADTSCTSQKVSMKATVTNSWIGSSTKYLWDFGDGTKDSSSSSVTHQYTKKGLFHILFTVIVNGSGVSAWKDSIYIGGVTAGISASNSCLGNAIQFKDSSSTLYTKIASEMWYFGDGKKDTAKNPSHTYGAAGQYTVSHVVFGTCGKDSVTKTITVYPTPKASFTYTWTCANAIAKITEGSTAPTGYTIKSWFWDFGDNTTSTSQNPSHIYKTPGKYLLTLTVTTNTGCTDKFYGSFVVLDAPKVSFTYTNHCSDSSVNFTNGTTIGGGNTISSYLWKFGDGSSSSSTSPSHTYSKAGRYSVTLYATSNNGCTDSSVNVVTVIPRPRPNFSFKNVCVNESVVLSNTSTIDSGYRISSYLWRFGDGTTATGSTPSKTYTKAGSYSITLIAYSNTGCVDSSTQTITIYPRAVPGFNSSFDCANSNVDFTNTSTGSSTYLWRFGDGTTSTAQNPAHAYSKTGTYQVTLVSNSSNGCPDSITHSVTTYDLPKAAFTDSFTCSRKVKLINQSTGAIKYIWDFGNGDTTSVLNPSFLVPASGSYKVSLTAINANGCADTVKQNVIIEFAPSLSLSIPRHACLSDSVKMVFSGFNIVSTSQMKVDFGDGSPVQKIPYNALTFYHTYSSAGTYYVKYTVSNSMGSCGYSYADTITVGQPTASLTLRGDTLISSSAAFYTWYDSASGKISGASGQKFVVQKTGTYYVTVTDSFGCSGSSAYMHVDLHDSLKGTVLTNSSSPIKNAWVFLVHYNTTDSTLDVRDSIKTDVNGKFAFSPPDTVCYLKAIPDSSNYPKDMPTWYDTSLTFVSAKAIAINNHYTNVTLYTVKGINTTGIGHIGGKIYACSGCKKERPKSGVEILLMKNNRPVDYTFTDTAGNFYFLGLDTGTYVLWADGPVMKNYNAPEVTLTTAQENKTDLELTWYPDHLEMLNTGILKVKEPIKVMVFPNPFNNEFRLTLSLPERQSVLITIMDLTGKTVYTNSLLKLPPGDTDIPVPGSKLHSGVYLLQVITEKGIITRKIVKVD